ncbi:hypothetical protein DIPPA_19269 [Diplonema papillatum]|nr:hypothetical protein DIPPA_25443 [Diplonema papillatum]KAJ9468639.1 hypothetical protein DIPPA_19269 [Diplonema papillatum]
MGIFRSISTMLKTTRRVQGTGSANDEFVLVSEADTLPWDELSSLVEEFGSGASGKVDNELSALVADVRERGLVLRVVLTSGFPVEVPEVILAHPDPLLIVSEHVLDDGRVVHPTLTEWEHPQSFAQAIRTVVTSLSAAPFRTREASINWRAPTAVSPVSVLSHVRAVQLETPSAHEAPPPSRPRQLEPVVFPQPPTSFPAVDRMSAEELNKELDEGGHSDLLREYKLKIMEKVALSKNRVNPLSQEVDEKRQASATRESVVAQKAKQVAELKSEVAQLRSDIESILQVRARSTKDLLAQSASNYQHAAVMLAADASWEVFVQVASEYHSLRIQTEEAPKLQR